MGGKEGQDGGNEGEPGEKMGGEERIRGNRYTVSNIVMGEERV